MGWLDQFEQHPLYRWAWDRPLFGHRPLTHSARAFFGRWPGVLLFGCLCFAMGAWAGGSAFWPALFLGLVFTLVNGHLWV